jgi:heat shock protein HslJ
MRRRRLVLSFIAVFSAGCDDDADEAEVVGYEWTLDSLRRADGSTATPTPGRYTLTLEPGGRAAVRSDCNSCSGGYTLAGGDVAFTPLACTRAYCGDTSLDPEYPRILGGARTLDADGRRLEIAGPDGALRYTR